MWTTRLVIVLFVIVLFVISDCRVDGKSSGVVLVRIARFLNPEGRDAAGACCNRYEDQSSDDEGICPAPCYTMFKVCANRLESKDVVVVEANNAPYRPPQGPPTTNLSQAVLDSRDELQWPQESGNEPPVHYSLREPVHPPNREFLQPKLQVRPEPPAQNIDSRQEEGILEKLFGGGKKDGPATIVKQFIPAFHRRKDHPQPARRPPQPVRKKPPPRGGPPPNSRYPRPPPARPEPPRLPPFRHGPPTSGGRLEPPPDLEQWRKAGYNVIWRQERQLLPTSESECSYGTIETKVLFNNSLQDVGDLLIRIPFQEDWEGLFSLSIEAWHVQNPVSIPQLKKESKEEKKSIFAKIFSTLADTLKTNLEEFVEESLEAKAKEKAAAAKNKTAEAKSEDDETDTTDADNETTTDIGSTGSDEDLETTTMVEETTTTEIPTTTLETVLLSEEGEEDMDRKGDKRTLIMRLERNHIMYSGEQWKDFNFVSYNARIDYSLRLACSKEYTGETCSFNKLCLNPALQNHPRMYCTAEGEMICRDGWTGPQCSTPLCKPGCHPTQGYCKQPGECKCKSGYRGLNCEECVTLPGCKYGTCNKGYECNCNEGYYGIFCNNPVCSEGCSEDNGYCRKPYTCSCKAGWTGTNCTECVPRKGCLHGTCENPNECNCDPSYTGVLCDEPVCREGCSPEII